MRPIFEQNVVWIKYMLKIFGYLTAVNLFVLPILWLFKSLHLFTLILVYEALFISVLGVFQILASYIYRENSIPYSWGSRTGWFAFKKFAELKREERQRYRREGIILVIVGLVLLSASVAAHFFLLAYS